MILVSVGTSDFNFDRLLKLIDDLCEENILNGEDIIAQIGYTSYIPKNYKYFNFVEKDKMDKYVEQSEYIIMHSGVGTIIGSLKNKKKIIVFPRLGIYNEHVDNHQLEIAKLFFDKKYILLAEDKSQLIECVKNIKYFNPNEFISGNEKINNILNEYLKKVEGEIDGE